ncbi:MAG: hypothetical protein QGG14_04070 [Planctomycetota bacterium]|nr:hypothetical protein [Planctomycetota bacterium]
MERPPFGTEMPRFAGCGCGSYQEVGPKEKPPSQSRKFLRFLK